MSHRTRPPRSTTSVVPAERVPTAGGEGAPVSPDAVSRRAATAAAAGDRRALATLLDLHGGRVLAVCRRLAGDEHEAEDLCQEVFVKLIAVLGRYDASRPFLPWLLRVTTNVCLNHLRSRRRRPAASLDAWMSDASPPVDPDAPRPPEQAATLERRDKLSLARARLGAEAQALLALRYEGGLGHAEIAEALGGIPVGTVKVRLHRARKALIHHLRAEGVVE